MTYYGILGVRENATSEEIKEAYRKLVKQYHPDRNKVSEATHLMAQINEAYDILSDPTKRAAYDSGFSTATFSEEDPREIWKREYIKLKREQKIKAEADIERFRSQTFRIARWISFPILLFALLIVTDDLLPKDKHKEVAEMGWQEVRYVGDRRSAYHRRYYVSYMKTMHFEFQVTNESHVNYDYYGAPDTLSIEVTRMFETLDKVSIVGDNQNILNRPGRKVPLPFLLLVSAAFTVLRKDYNLMNYSLCFLPLLLLALTIVFYIF